MNITNPQYYKKELLKMLRKYYYYIDLSNALDKKFPNNNHKFIYDNNTLIGVEIYNQKFIYDYENIYS